MLIFRGFFNTQKSDRVNTSKRTKLHHIFKIFSGELAYVPELPRTWVQP